MARPLRSSKLHASVSPACLAALGARFRHVGRAGDAARRGEYEQREYPGASSFRALSSAFGVACPSRSDVASTRCLAPARPDAVASAQSDRERLARVALGGGPGPRTE